MSTAQSFVDYVQEQARLGDRLTVRKMFGEYALYLDQKVVALACDDSLFIKQLDATTTLSEGLPLGPPYPGARPHLIGDLLLDDPDRLQALLEATAVALPPPKPRRPATPRKKGRGTAS